MFGPERLAVAALIAASSICTFCMLGCNSQLPPQLPWTYIALGNDQPAFELERAQLAWNCGKTKGEHLFSPRLHFLLDTSSIWNGLRAGDSIQAAWHDLPNGVRELLTDHACSSGEDLVTLSISDNLPATWRAAQAKRGNEQEWLAFEMGLSDPEHAPDLIKQIHSKGWASRRPIHAKSVDLVPGQILRLEMRVAWPDGEQIGTSHRFEFNWGDEDQSLPCIEGWLRSGGAEPIWSTSKMAFGEIGLPALELPPKTPVIIFISRV